MTRAEHRTQLHLVRESEGTERHPDVYRNRDPKLGPAGGSKGVDASPGRSTVGVDPVPSPVDQQSETVPCPRCVRGMFTDLNGARWRCGRCGGSGRVPRPPEGTAA